MMILIMDDNGKPVPLAADVMGAMGKLAAKLLRVPYSQVVLLPSDYKTGWKFKGKSK